MSEWREPTPDELRSELDRLILAGDELREALVLLLAIVDLEDCCAPPGGELREQAKRQARCALLRGGLAPAGTPRAVRL